MGCVAVRRIVVLFRRVVLVVSLSRVPVVASSLSSRGSFVVRWLVLVVGVSRWWWLFSCVVVAVSVCGRPFLFVLRRPSSFEGWCSSWGVRRCLSGRVRCWAVVATRRVSGCCWRWASHCWLLSCDHCRSCCLLVSEVGWVRLRGECSPIDNERQIHRSSSGCHVAVSDVATRRRTTNPSFVVDR